MMKKFQLLLILLIVLTFQSCGLIFNICGKSVEIGEFLVLQESIDRWFPERGTSELVFVNSNNDKMSLSLVHDSAFMQVQYGKTICFEEAWDNSEEFIRTQWIEIIYAHGLNQLKIEFVSGWLNGFSEPVLDQVFDQVHFYNETDKMGGTMELIASDRGNDIDPEILPPPYPEFAFADSTMINGQWFEDIWYFGLPSDTVNLPSLYVKEHVDILAFRDSNRNVWLKESEL